MDVGAPSNFVRILEIFDNKFVDLSGKLEAVSVSDDNDRANDDRCFQVERIHS